MSKFEKTQKKDTVKALRDAVNSTQKPQINSMLEN